MGLRRLIALAAVLGLLQPLQLTAAVWTDAAAGCSMTACTCRHHGRAARATPPEPEPAAAACHLGADGAAHPEEAGPEPNEAPTLCGCGQAGAPATVAGHAPCAVPSPPALAPDEAIATAEAPPGIPLPSRSPALPSPPPRQSA